jgi:NitT/TauT family transport system ATP-binding protein
MTTTANPMVEVRSVSKTYPGGVEALNDIVLDFPEGRLTTLLGPSGCGKTTLLKIIAGLIPATAGEVIVDGRPVTGPGPERAFVFQDFALMPWADVMRNVAFGLELRGMARAEREAIAARYIGEVGLKGFERAYPHALSGGMRQRVGLARALAVKTFVFVTHSIEEAVYVSDRIVLLSRRPSRVSSIVEPDISRAMDPDAIRRNSTYIDTVEAIWQELKHYLDEV